MLEQTHLVQARIFRHPNVVGEGAEHVCSQTASPQSGNCYHARIIPTVNKTVLDQLDQFPFAHYRISEIEPREFDLPRSRGRELERFQNPFIKRAMDFKLEGAQRMRNSFDIVTQCMGPIVHWIDAPFIAGVMV